MKIKNLKQYHPKIFEMTLVQTINPYPEKRSKKIKISLTLSSSSPPEHILINHCPHFFHSFSLSHTLAHHTILSKSNPSMAPPTRTTRSHQLSNGLYVSGRSEPSATSNRLPTLSSSRSSIPYTGGDIKNSGELGKMFNIDTNSSATSSVRSGPNSGHQSSQKPNLSGPMSRKSSGSGPIPLQPTGLITSGPIGSNRTTTAQSVQNDGSGKGKIGYGSGVTSVNEGVKYGVRVSKGVMWVVVVVGLMGLVVGGFMMVAVKSAAMLAGVGAGIGVVGVVVGWSWVWRKRGIREWVEGSEDSELREAVDGQCVKVSGIVTCGSTPLESSFQKVPRCVYVSTELHEYKGCRGKSANPRHHRFSWGRRYSEKYVADFYVSDRKTGLRAMVKADSGAKVATFVKPATTVNINDENKNSSPDFLSWLADRNLSSDDRVMRLKEGYIKEGNIVTVMGMLRRQDNILMIVPPTEPIQTTFQWKRCLLPIYVQGLVLMCDEDQNAEVIPV
ncbi:hypothetical protein Drorol1_Dr00005474 [Drosera rotundifolia]